jgi:hypothetical protein
MTFPDITILLAVFIGRAWKYLKVPQKEFERLQPEALVDLNALTQL